MVSYHLSVSEWLINCSETFPYDFTFCFFGLVSSLEVKASTVLSNSCSLTSRADQHPSQNVSKYGPCTHASESSESADSAIIEKYVRERQKSFLDLAINRKSSEAVRYMISRGLIDEDALREYLNRSAVSGRVEITAILLDGLKDTKENCGLSEDPFE